MMKKLLMVLFLAGVSGMIAGCGPDLYEGSWVQFQVNDRDPVVIESETEISVWKDVIFPSGRQYELDLGTELSLRWPSGEVGVYGVNVVEIRRVEFVNYANVRYSTDYCDSPFYDHITPMAVIEIKHNDYGLISGTFMAVLCRHYSSFQNAPESIQVGGNFSASVKSSMF